MILPDLNGFYVCSALRLDPATASVPIIMMTAVPGEIPRLSRIETGADAYLNKPFSINGLVALVQDLLHGTRSNSAAFESIQTLAAGVSFAAPIKWSGITVG